ncbi:MAG: transcriptional regulator, partial [Candidatus Amesbacteria bacterium GW2011_GWA1_48_9]
MSGHSKWSTIKRQKEVKDAKKGAIFTKLATAITVAVRQSGGVADPDQNFRLRLAVEKARQFNMPKDNISRAIDKGTGTGGGERMSEAVFEGFLPGGAAVIIETVTDNKLRTAQEIKTLLDKGGGSLGSSGAVGYLFNQLGELKVKVRDTSLKSMDEQELEMIDLGIEDVEVVEDGFLIYCEPKKTFEIKQRLEDLGYEVESADLVMKPFVPLDLPQEENTPLLT